MIPKQNKSLQVILPLAVMTLLAILTVLATAGIYRQVWGSYEQPVHLPDITRWEAVPMTEEMPETVTALEAGYEAAGTLVAYRVQTITTGYNPDTPILLAVTVSSNGDALYGIEVLRQKESEYYGARIATDEFESRFAGKRLPLYLTGVSGRGAHVDGISGATVSSTAVVNAVNAAGNYIREKYVYFPG